LSSSDESDESLVARAGCGNYVKRLPMRWLEIPGIVKKLKRRWQRFVNLNTQVETLRTNC